MVVDRYPHYLYKVEGGTSERDERGDVIDVPNRLVFVSRCREETNGSGSSVALVNGTAYVFHSSILLPKNAPTIEEGMQIVVYDQEADEQQKPRVEGACSKYDVGRLHNRMWV